MTTPAKIVTTTTTAAELKKYEDMDVDQLLSQLSPEEIQILAKEVDPDVSLELIAVVFQLELSCSFILPVLSFQVLFCSNTAKIVL